MVTYRLYFSFKIQYLRVFRRRKPEIFTHGAFIFLFADKYLSKCLKSTLTRLPNINENIALYVLGLSFHIVYSSVSGFLLKSI